MPSQFTNWVPEDSNKLSSSVWAITHFMRGFQRQAFALISVEFWLRFWRNRVPGAVREKKLSPFDRPLYIVNWTHFEDLWVKLLQKSWIKLCDFCKYFAFCFQSYKQVFKRTENDQKLRSNFLQTRQKYEVRSLQVPPQKFQNGQCFLLHLVYSNAHEKVPALWLKWHQVNKWPVILIVPMVFSFEIFRFETKRK